MILNNGLIWDQVCKWIATFILKKATRINYKTWSEQPGDKKEKVALASVTQYVTLYVATQYVTLYVAN